MSPDVFLHDACHGLCPPLSSPAASGYAAVTRAERGNNTRPLTGSDLRLSLAVMDGEKKKLRLSFGYLILGLWAVLLVQQVLSAYLRPNRISYSDFKVAVAQNKVEEPRSARRSSRAHEGSGGRAPRRTPHQPQRRRKPRSPHRRSRPTKRRRGKSRDAFETIRVDDPIC
jgi:hypothetical protein